MYLAIHIRNRDPVHACAHVLASLKIAQVYRLSWPDTTREYLVGPIVGPIPCLLKKPGCCDP
jgi:hypothetical protein